MSSDALTIISSFFADSAERPGDIVRLHDLQVFIGKLPDLIEPDGEGIVLTRIKGELVELPKTLSAPLWAMMGKRIIAGHIAGQYQAELSTQ